MINWDVFKENTKSYFQSYLAKDSDQAAEFISLQYDAAIRTGTDFAYGNPIAIGNKPALTSGLKVVFKMGYNSTGLYDSLGGIGNAMVGYWSGATLSPFRPPPGAVAVVPGQNFVLNPGVATGFPTPPTKSFDAWLNGFVTMARIHLSTLAGTTIAMVSSPAGPIPTPFPWLGYG